MTLNVTDNQYGRLS